MKLIRFITTDSPNPRFGVVVGDHAVPFAVLHSKARTTCHCLTGSRSYLANLPDSERAAKALFASTHAAETDPPTAAGHIHLVQFPQGGVAKGCHRSDVTS